MLKAFIHVFMWIMRWERSISIRSKKMKATTERGREGRKKNLGMEPQSLVMLKAQPLKQLVSGHRDINRPAKATHALWNLSSKVLTYAKLSTERASLFPLKHAHKRFTVSINYMYVYCKFIYMYMYLVDCLKRFHCGFCWPPEVPCASTQLYIQPFCSLLFEVSTGFGWITEKYHTKRQSRRVFCAMIRLHANYACCRRVKTRLTREAWRIDDYDE